MGRYRVGIETRSRILDATRNLLAEEGFEKTTLKAICTRAEVGSGSFYNQFESKEDAILQVVRDAIDGVDPDPQRGGTDSVATLTKAWVQFLESSPQLARIYLRIAVAGAVGERSLASRVARHDAARVERFAAALQRETRATGDDANRVATVLTAALTGLAVRWMLDDAIDLAGHARAACDSAVSSLHTEADASVAD